MEEFYQTVLKLAGLEDNEKNRLEVDSAFEWANNYCKRKFSYEDAPLGFLKGVAVLAASGDQTPNVVSESVAGELSVTYNSEATKAAVSYLNAYRRVVFR